MPQGTLYGFAMPAQMWPRADHTYVTSSDGGAWGCYGRCTGGTLICSGNGNTAVANCLARPNAQAGIVYGINGLCHQMSNRILYPAGQMHSEREFDRRVAEIHFGRAEPDDSTAIALDARRAEFRAMATAFLGDSYDDDKLRRIETIHVNMLDQQLKLVEQYNRDIIGPADYVDCFNALAFENFAAMQAVLGREDYLKLFGPLPDKSQGFIDRDAFLHDHNQRRLV